MRPEKAISKLLRFLCTAVVLLASNLIVLSSFSSVKQAAAATGHSHDHFSEHIARTLPHPHDVSSSHSHEHGVPAPDGAAPLAKGVPEAPQLVAMILLPWLAVRALHKAAIGSDEKKEPPATGTFALWSILSASDCVQALIFAPQAPPFPAQ